MTRETTREQEESTAALIPAPTQEKEPCSALERYIKDALPSLAQVFGPSQTLVESPERRAEILLGEFDGLNKQMHYSLITIGWMIIQAGLCSMHTHAPGYQGETLKQWVCKQANMPPSMYDHAYELGKAWEYLSDSKVPLEVLMDARFTLCKARHVNKIKVDANRQIKIRAEKLRAEAPEDTLDQAEIAERAQAEYFSDVQAHIIDVVVNLSDHDLEVEAKRAIGQKERPIFYLRNVRYVNGEILGELRSLCDIDGLEVLAQGKYATAFFLEGEEDSVAPRQVGERFIAQVAAELDEDPSF